LNATRATVEQPRLRQLNCRNIGISLTDRGSILSECNGLDPVVTWHIKEFGGGVLVFDPAVSGHTFIPTDQLDDYEDLEFVSRART
jgi:hypothetical protein